ncbi:MAG: methanogenesis marker 8 protein [Candidatus Methanomethylophilaceae archaeon]|jgi:putative methanogenesis marker protein 8
MSDKNVMEALGLSKVTIVDGKVVEVTEPKVKYCPLFKRVRNIDELNCCTVKENMEYRIKTFGMCTDDRVTRMGNFLSFGVSEMLCLACKVGILDAAVIAADGCGTAVIDDPEIIQGMGGRISAIIETVPSENVISDIGKGRVLDPENATIDQIAGVRKAFDMGYSKVGVSTPFADQAEYFRKTYGDRIMIFGVHTTGISEADARKFFQYADIITSCASKWVREVAKECAVLQAGTKVPVYGATEAGAELMRAKLKELGKEPDTELTDGPYPLL